MSPKSPLPPIPPPRRESRGGESTSTAIVIAQSPALKEIGSLQRLEQLSRSIASDIRSLDEKDSETALKSIISNSQWIIASAKEMQGRTFGAPQDLLEPLDTILKDNKITYIVVDSIEVAIVLYLYEQHVGGFAAPSSRHPNGILMVRGEHIVFQTPAGNAFTVFLQGEVPKLLAKRLKVLHLGTWTFDPASCAPLKEFMETDEVKERVAQLKGQVGRYVPVKKMKKRQRVVEENGSASSSEDASEDGDGREE